MAVRLYVGNLPYTTAEEDLRSLFDQSGAVAACDIVLDRFTGKPRGFAFVEMATQEDARNAIDQFHDHEFEGRKLVVNEARPRDTHGAGTFGGFGGRPSGGGHGGTRKSGKGSRRGARNAKRNKKSFW